MSCAKNNMLYPQGIYNKSCDQDINMLCNQDITLSSQDTCNN